MLRRIGLILPLSLLLTACSGGGGGSATGGAATQPAADAPVALSVQWPASLTGGAVRSSSIGLPSRVLSLTMEVQVLAPDFAGQRHTVAVTREGGSEVTRVDGVVQPPEVNGLDLQVPVGTPRRFFVTATAEVVDAAGAAETLHFTGFLDLTVTGDGDGGVVVLHDGDGAADGVPQITRVDLVDGAPPALRVDSAAVDLNVTATFSDGFGAFEPPAAWSSDDPGVAQVDDTGLLSPAGKGSATLTVTVGGVPLHLPVTVENTPPMDLTTQDKLPPAGEGGAAGIGDQTVAEDGTLLLDLAADDPDGDPLSFAAASDAPQVAAAIAGSQLTLAPAANFHGTAAITVTADDGDGGTATDTFTLTVTPVNDAPVLAAIADQVNGDSTAVNLATVATDVDGDPLTYGAAGLPAGLAINPNSGLISGTIAPAAPVGSPYAVTVTVSDSTATASRAFSWQVNDVTPPVVNAPADLPGVEQAGPAGTSATDPSIQAFLSAASATDNVAVASLINNAPPTFPAGPTTVTFTATDTSGHTTQGSATVTVQDTTPPEVTLLFPMGGIVDATTTVSIIATDVATDVASVTVTGPLNPGAPVDLARQMDPANWRAEALDVGGLGTPLTVTTTDGAGNTASLNINLQVGAAAAVGGGAVGLLNAVDLATEPDGRLVLPDPTLSSVFRVDPRTGSRFVVTDSRDGQPNPFGSPAAVTVRDNAGQEEIILTATNVATKAQALFAVDPASGTRALITDETIPPSLGTWLDVALGLRGDLLVLDQSECSQVLGVDAATGVQNAVAGPNPPCFPVAVAEDASSILLVEDTIAAVYRVDARGNAFVFSGSDFSTSGPVGGGPELVAPNDLAMAAEGGIWVADTGLPAVFQVDPSTGDRTLVSGVDVVGKVVRGTGPEFLSVTAVAVDSLGRIYILGDDGTYVGIWQIDPITGDRALISASRLPLG